MLKEVIPENAHMKERKGKGRRVVRGGERRKRTGQEGQENGLRYWKKK
jgi:hypothetical protein